MKKNDDDDGSADDESCMIQSGSCRDDGASDVDVDDDDGGHDVEVDEECAGADAYDAADAHVANNSDR